MILERPAPDKLVGPVRNMPARPAISIGRQQKIILVRDEEIHRKSRITTLYVGVYLAVGCKTFNLNNELFPSLKVENEEKICPKQPGLISRKY